MTFEAVQLQALRKALATYDEGVQDRADALEHARTYADILGWQDEQRRALELVQDAFHWLTFPYNTIDHCRLAGIEFIRRCAKRFVAS